MKELKEKNEKELTDMLAERREELRSVRFGTAGSKSRDVFSIRKGRKEIARIFTEMNSRKNA